MPPLYYYIAIIIALQSCVAGEVLMICPPGHFRGNVSSEECPKCEDGTFTETYNRQERCTPCSTCTDGKEETARCNTTSNRRCQCPKNAFENSEGACTKTIDDRKQLFDQLNTKFVEFSYNSTCEACVYVKSFINATIKSCTCDSYSPAIISAIASVSTALLLTPLIIFLVWKVLSDQKTLGQSVLYHKIPQNTDENESPSSLDLTQGAQAASGSFNCGAGTPQAEASALASLTHGSGALQSNTMHCLTQSVPCVTGNVLQGTGSTNGSQAALGNAVPVSGSAQAVPAISTNFANVAGSPQNVLAVSGNVQGAGVHQAVQAPFGNVIIGNVTPNGPAQAPRPASINASHQAGYIQNMQVAATTVDQGSGSAQAVPAISKNFANVAGSPQNVQAVSGNVQGAGVHQAVQAPSGNVIIGNVTPNGPAQAPRPASMNASHQAGYIQNMQVAATTVDQGSAPY